jgi:hypothetical protein
VQILKKGGIDGCGSGRGKEEQAKKTSHGPSS